MPKEGPQRRGKNIIVIGREFVKSNKVVCNFGKFQTIGVFINTHKAICPSPNFNAPGKYRFSISFKNGIFSGGQIFYYIFRTPILISLSPTCGPTEGNTEILIKGNNFLKSN